KYHVLHNPNYNFHAKTDPFETGNRIGMKFKNQHAIYMLSNENSIDDILYGGMALANIPYRYLVFAPNGTILNQELFFRDATNTTAFDVFNRQETRLTPNQLEYVKVGYSYPGASDEVEYTSYLSRTTVHPFSEVYTINIKANEDDLDTMHEDVLANITIPVEFSRMTYTDAKLSVDGTTQRLWKKLSYKLDLPEDQSINGFRKFKLRSLSSDPSYMRERIYYDMLNVAGVPGAKGSYVRLFINSVPQGLYLLIDRYESPFLENIFNMTPGSGPHGGLIHGQVVDIHSDVIDIEGSTLQYKGMQPSAYVTLDGKEFYDVTEDSSDGDTMDALIAFMSFIESTKSISLPNPVVEQKDIEAQNKLVEQWNTYFDVSVFLKNVGVELFMSNTDGYCQSGANFYLYQDISQNGRFVYMPYNVDLVMGSTLFPAKDGNTILQDLDRYRVLSFINKRPLLKQILAVPLFRDRFRTIIKDYYHALFSNSAAGNYLAYIKALIQDDAEWDSALFRFRKSNFVGKEELYEQLLEKNLYKYPLGRDFMLRQDIIPFEQAVRGPIRDTPSLVGVYEQFNTTRLAIEKYSARIIAQIVVSLSSVITRAFVAAYKQAAASMYAVHGGRLASSGRTGTKEAVIDALTRKTNMSMKEACQILNITKEADLTKLINDHLFSTNDPTKGGSFYIQSKVVRAKERFLLSFFFFA
ncbi:hypothetical protein K501DRAFT_308427, partial [Backusella circina FSU 941]